MNAFAASLSNAPAYGWLMLLAIGVSIAFWRRQAKKDQRLLYIYGAALAAAFFGAKVVFLLAEGWLYFHDPHRWIILATGKSVIGALLGGYAGVELAKYFLGYRSATGDLFASIVPAGIMVGRMGCMLHGCCLGAACPESWFTVKDAAGVDRWPASQVEFVFNAGALVILSGLRRRGALKGQLFHLYLIAYGVFRFAHEFWRDTPPVLGIFTGYQIAALCVVGLGTTGFILRFRTVEPLPSIGTV